MSQSPDPRGNPTGPVPGSGYPHPGGSPVPPQSVPAGPGPQYPQAPGGFAPSGSFYPSGPEGQIPRGSGSAEVSKRRGAGFVLGLIGAVVLGLIVAGAGVWFFVLRDAGSSAGQAKTPTETMTEFLNAVADGDVDKARELSSTPPAEAPTLTSEFVKKAREKHPITNIEVKEDSKNKAFAEMLTTYSIGDHPVSVIQELINVDGVWKVQDPTSKVEGYHYAWHGLSVTLNGLPFAEEPVELFPGIYELSTGSKHLTFANPLVVVEAGDPLGQVMTSPKPELSAEGLAHLKSETEGFVNRCIKIQELAPTGCLFKATVASGVVPVKSTIKWVVWGSSLGNFAPTLKFDDPNSVFWPVNIRVRATFTDTKGRQHVANSSVGAAQGRIDGDAMAVTFSNQ